MSLKVSERGKVFCRENAVITVNDSLKTDSPLNDQVEANWHVAEELTYWTE